VFFQNGGNRKLAMMERTQALKRIIELAMKWQDPAHWNIMFQAESKCKHLDEQASFHQSEYHRFRKYPRGKKMAVAAKSPDPVYAELCRDSAAMHREAAAILRSDSIALKNEVFELQNLVRLHAPTVLEFTVMPADTADCAVKESQVEKLKRLEGSVRAMQTPPPPKVSTLPFNLHLCDVPQTLRRDGFPKVVTIPNEGHWNLMKALMAAFPNPVSESKRKHLFEGPNDSDNYSRKLKDTIDDIGLTVEKLVLIDTTDRP